MPYHSEFNNDDLDLLLCLAASKVACDASVAANLIPPLVALARVRDSTATHARCAAALCQLAAAPGAARLMVTEGAIDALIAMMTSATSATVIVEPPSGAAESGGDDGAAASIAATSASATPANSALGTGRSGS